MFLRTQALLGLVGMALASLLHGCSKVAGPFHRSKYITLWMLSMSELQGRTGVLVARHGPLLANAIFLPAGAQSPFRLSYDHVLHLLLLCLPE